MSACKEMTEEELFVYSHWTRVTHFPQVGICVGPELWCIGVTWAAAAEKTRERERQIAEVREEIAQTLRDLERERRDRESFTASGFDALALNAEAQIAIYKRIRERTVQALEILLIGWKCN